MSNAGSGPISSVQTVEKPAPFKRTTTRRTKMEDIISQTKAEYNRAKDRIVRDLETTPDDKIHWSPSSTARTPISQVAHAALAVAGIQGMMVGKPFPWANVV